MLKWLVYQCLLLKKCLEDESEVTGWIDPGTSEKKTHLKRKVKVILDTKNKFRIKWNFDIIPHNKMKNVLEMIDTWRDVCPRTGPDLWRCKRRFPSPTAPPSHTGVAWGQSSGHLRSCLFEIILVRFLECKDEKSLRTNISVYKMKDKYYTVRITYLRNCKLRIKSINGWMDWIHRWVL